MAQQHPREPLPDDTFRASSLSGCVRQCTMAKLGLQSFDIATYRHFEVGTILHRYIQEKVALGFIDAPVQFEKKVELQAGNNKILGHVDIWDGKIVYDLKSTSSLEFSAGRPLPISYEYQISAYAHALKASEAYIIYIDKRNLNTATMKAEIMPLEKIAGFCDRVREAIREYHKSGKLPDKDVCFVCQKES